MSYGFAAWAWFLWNLKCSSVVLCKTRWGISIIKCEAIKAAEFYSQIHFLAESTSAQLKLEMQVYSGTKCIKLYLVEALEVFVLGYATTQTRMIFQEEVYPFDLLKIS